MGEQSKENKHDLHISLGVYSACRSTSGEATWTSLRELSQWTSETHFLVHKARLKSLKSGANRGMTRKGGVAEPTL